jgi:triacylglycerol lipase
MNRLLQYSLVVLLFAANAVSGDECVVLLHGLGRTSASMQPIEQRLKKEGYAVFNISYPSTKYSIEELCSLFVRPEIDRCINGHDSVSFVTHSMGAIVARYILTKKMYPCKSIVMLCPPNGGSHLSGALRRNIGWLYRLIDGPAGQQLGTDSLSILPKLAELRGKTGIIAGDRSWEPIFSRIIPGDDDGKVAVDETKLPEMTDFIILNHTHTFMMNNRDTQDQVLSFLRKGVFFR